LFRRQLLLWSLEKNRALRDRLLNVVSSQRRRQRPLDKARWHVDRHRGHGFLLRFIHGGFYVVARRLNAVQFMPLIVDEILQSRPGGFHRSARMDDAE